VVGPRRGESERGREEDDRWGRPVRESEHAGVVGPHARESASARTGHVLLGRAGGEEKSARVEDFVFLFQKCE
jgi:hypothetical protein